MKYAWLTLAAALLGCAGNPPTPGTAPAPGPTTFVVIADTQQMPPIDWFLPGGSRERSLVRRKIEELRPEYIILAGDIVGDGFFKPYWKQFRQEYGHLPIWPVLGNHDLHGPNSIALKHYFETFPKVNGRRWYTLRQPPLLFFMLDSNFSNMSDAEFKEQRAWLETEFDRAEADPEIRGVFLVTHHPPLSAHGSGGNTKVRESFWDPAAKRRKFVAFFSGHHHSYQHIQVGEKHAFVCGGAGAPLALWRTGKLPPEARLVCSRNAHHLLRATAERDAVRISMLELQKDQSWSVQEETLLSLLSEH